MADLRLVTIESVAELRAVADRWDDLWQASEAVLPTLRADLLALWVEQFAPCAKLRMLAVEQDGRFIAAIPLLSRRRMPGWEVGEMTGNQWTPAADLLLDPEADWPAALDLIVAQMQRLPWTTVHFQAIDRRLDRWQHWCAALDRRGAAHCLRDRFAIPMLQISDDWSKYVAGLSSNHKRQMNRADRKAGKAGGVELRIVRDLQPSDVESWLRRGFEVEDRNWKGQAGSSVLKVPGIFDYFVAQARQLAAWGQLMLVFLEHRQQPIAFEYGWLSKQVFQPLKVGYDASFAHLSPGQLLRWRLFEQMHRGGWCQSVDFIGLATRATSAWANDSYVLSRQIIAPRRMSGRVALYAYQNWWPQVQRLRHLQQRRDGRSLRTVDTLEASSTNA